jgi:hypothetical protein
MSVDSVVPSFMRRASRKVNFVFKILLSRVNFILGFISFNNWWKTDNFSELWFHRMKRASKHFFLFNVIVLVSSSPHQVTSSWWSLCSRYLNVDVAYVGSTFVPMAVLLACRNFFSRRQICCFPVLLVILVAQNLVQNDHLKMRMLIDSNFYRFYSQMHGYVCIQINHIKWHKFFILWDFVW